MDFEEKKRDSSYDIHIHSRWGNNYNGGPTNLGLSGSGSRHDLLEGLQKQALKVEIGQLFLL